MKKILTLILMCFYGQLTISQHLVEFGIININNNEPIEGAYIEILGIGDTKTDEFGKAIFEEVEEGRISVVIRKKGYLSITKSDINISRPNSLNTNNWIIELSPSSKNVISIIGKVENENEKTIR